MTLPQDYSLPSASATETMNFGRNEVRDNLAIPSRSSDRNRFRQQPVLYNKRVSTESVVEQSAEPHTTHKALHLKTFFAISIMVLSGPVGNLFLGKGMKEVGLLTLWPPNELLHTGIRTFTTVSIWIGILSLITFFIANALVLSWADYSFVQPASSMAYGVVALLGYFVLNEKVTPLHWTGIAIICLGVFVVSRTGPRTTRRHTPRPDRA
jgi:hypothetical protein